VTGACEKFETEQECGFIRQLYGISLVGQGQNDRSRVSCAARIVAVLQDVQHPYQKRGGCGFSGSAERPGVALPGLRGSMARPSGGSRHRLENASPPGLRGASKSDVLSPREVGVLSSNE